MYKSLSWAAFIVTLATVNMAPVFANPANIKTGNKVTVNSVAPKSSVVEIDGRTLTNSEAAKVEGQVSRITIRNTIQFGICVIGVVSPCNGSKWQPKPIVRPFPMPMPIIRPFPSR